MRRSKYGAVKTMVDGRTFASKREAARYQELRLLERAGEIRDLECQPVYPIFSKLFGGSKEKRVSVYIADFRYHDAKRGYVVEDVKGVKTPVYRLKKRLVEAQYGITVCEI